AHERLFDRRTRLARVTAQDDPGRPAGRRGQGHRQRPADPLDRPGVERELARDPADAVGAEQPFHLALLRRAFPGPPSWAGSDAMIETLTRTGPEGATTWTRLPAGASGIGVTSTS